MAKKKETYTAKVTDYPIAEEVVDNETGELKMKMTETTRTLEVPILEDFVDIKIPKKFHFNNGGFITVFQKAIANIALFANLSKEEYKMLLYLIGTCGPSNSVCMDLVKLSEALSMKKPNVSRALKGLVERNIVIRKDGYRYGKEPLPFELHLNFDQLNYNMAYNGFTKQFGKRKAEHPALMQKDGETPLIPEKKNKQELLQEIAENNEHQANKGELHMP